MDLVPSAVAVIVKRELKHSQGLACGSWRFRSHQDKGYSKPMFLSARRSAVNKPAYKRKEDRYAMSAFRVNSSSLPGKHQSWLL